MDILIHDINDHYGHYNNVPCKNAVIHRDKKFDNIS